MKKPFFISACVLIIVAVGFILYSLGNSEVPFPWSPQITKIIYGVYADVIVLLIVMAFWKKSDRGSILAIILELAAVFCLVQSLLTVFPKGESNWYLPLAWGFNCVALLLNAMKRRKKEVG